MAGTSLAMMVVPLVSDIFVGKKLVTINNLFVTQLIHVLLDIYGFRGTTLIVGGWALHSVVGSCLLRPLEEQPPPSPPPVKVITLIHEILNHHVQNFYN